MEEYIKVLKGFLNTEVLYGRMALTSPQVDILKHAITNLINKNKEQEKHIEALNSVVIEHMEKNKEQEKIIELMASFIEVAELDEDIAKTYCKNEACTEINEFTCKKCIIDYFKKKARENNEP